MTGPSNPDTGGNPPGPGPYQPIEQSPDVDYELNLKPFQYQIGGVVFGHHTNYPVNQIDVQTYNVNVQDFQVIRTNERQFGVDTLAPGSLVFKMGVLDNRPLPNMVGLTGDSPPPSLIARQGVLLPALAREWKALETIVNWGETKPIYYCDFDGSIKRLYGRPGKFTYSKRTEKSAYFDVQAEYRRSDTFAYSDTEYFVGDASGDGGGLAPGAPAVVAARLDGDADAWLRILFVGPFANPTLTYGGNQVALDLSIGAGTILEVNSYPWERRVIDSTGINWRSQLSGETVYLDQLQFPAGTSMPISWVQEGSATSETQAYFCWREAYNVLP